MLFGRDVVFLAEDLVEITNAVLIFERMTQSLPPVGGVVISSFFLADFQHLFFNQLGQNPLSSALSDPKLISQVSNT